MNKIYKIALNFALIILTLNSCSKQEDYDNSTDSITIQNSKFLQTNKDTLWESNLNSVSFFYIKGWDITDEFCLGLLTFLKVDILIDTPTTFSIAYNVGKDFVNTWTINGNTLIFDSGNGAEHTYSQSKNEPAACIFATSFK